MFKKLFGMLSKSSSDQIISADNTDVSSESVSPEPILEFEIDDMGENTGKPEEISTSLLDKPAPLVYIFQVDETGNVGLSFKCSPNYEVDFGAFLSKLMTGGLNEEIVSALQQVLNEETLNKVMIGLGPVVDELFDIDYDEAPIIAPSKVFHGVEKT